jgi:receptor protein-tyrosine kinase
MELREMWSAIRAGWWLAVIGALVGGLAAIGVSLAMTPLYTAQTQLFISTTTSASEVFQASQFSEKRAASYAELLTGAELAGRVVLALDLPMEPQDLASQITATTRTGTVLIDVGVTDASPQRAVLIAEAYGTEFAQMVSELEKPTAAGVSPVRVNVTDAPEVPRSPSYPVMINNIAFGLLAGLLAGCAAVIVRSRLDKSVSGPKEVSDLAGAPLLGVIPRDRELGTRHVIEENTFTDTAEAFRHLCANIQLLDGGDPPRVIMVSSPTPAEGRTTTAINLAMALVEVDRKVAILEADLRRPQVAQFLGVNGGIGLTNVLRGSADLSDAGQRYGEGGLVVIAAGPTPPNPSELIASDHMIELLGKLRGENDFVLVVAPPLLPVADASRLAALTDGVLLCARYGGSTREQLSSAARKVRGVGGRTIGVVLNAVPRRVARDGDLTALVGSDRPQP